MAEAFGIEKVKTPFADSDLKRVRDVAGGVDAARNTTAEAAATLKELITQGLPADAREKLANVAKELENASSELQRPDQLLTNAVAAQQKAPGGDAKPEGWIYLGHVDETKSTWDPKPRTVQTRPLLKPGEVITVTDDVYVRADSASPRRNQAPVVGVVRAGQDVTVMDVSYTHAARGGWFLWVRVART